MWHLKTTTAPLIVGALGMIKKGAEMHINKLPDSRGPHEIIFKMHFAELLISLKEYYRCDWNITKKRQQI